MVVYANDELKQYWVLYDRNEVSKISGWSAKFNFIDERGKNLIAEILRFMALLHET